MTAEDERGNEMTGYPLGIDLIEKGKCPINAKTPMACMFCPTGHMTECHYPYDCYEAQCSHLERYE
jgi:hypothetical protein